MAMELVEGDGLDQRIASGLSRGVDWFAFGCDALVGPGTAC